MWVITSSNSPTVLACQLKWGLGMYLFHQNEGGIRLWENTVLYKIQNTKYIISTLSFLFPKSGVVWPSSDKAWGALRKDWSDVMCPSHNPVTPWSARALNLHLNWSNLRQHGGRLIQHILRRACFVSCPVTSYLPVKMNNILGHLHGLLTTKSTPIMGHHHHLHGLLSTS